MRKNIKEEGLSLLKEPITEEYKSHIIEKAIQEKEKEQKILDEIFKTDEYINWLENFTQEHKVFYTTDWLYRQEELSQKDKENLSKIKFLFEKIIEYGNENYIYPNQINEYEYEYYIKHNKMYYKIGINLGQGSSFFVERTEVDNKKTYIDFQNIKTRKISSKTIIIKQQLKELRKLIERLSKNDIPLEAIEEVSTDTIERLKKSKTRKKGV